jgi:uncharacterized membrane protein YccC
MKGAPIFVAVFFIFTIWIMLVILVVICGLGFRKIRKRLDEIYYILIGRR